MQRPYSFLTIENRKNNYILSVKKFLLSCINFLQIKQKQKDNEQMFPKTTFIRAAKNLSWVANTQHPVMLNPI